MKLKKSSLFGIWLLLSPAAFSRAASDLSSLNVFPNPVREYMGESSATFANLTTQVRIRIYDVNGHLVRDAGQTDPGDQFVWTLTNDSGNKVASGVYIFLITNDAGQKRSGKIAIVR